MKSQVRIFFVSPKRDTFAVGEVFTTMSGCTFSTGIKGSLTVPSGTQVGATLDFEGVKFSAIPDPSNDQYMSLSITPE